MASGDGSIEIRVVLPAELVWLAKRYQRRRRIAVFSGVFKELLETHPALVLMADELYNEPVHQPSEGNAHT